MKQVFLDSGFVIALEDKHDQYHAQAVSQWDKLTEKVVTTSYIVNEVVTAFNIRNLHDKAVEIGEILVYSSDVTFIQVDDALFFEAWEYFKKHHDKTYSFTDCVSFVVMKQLDIQDALTFDNHFKQAGFTAWA